MIKAFYIVLSGFMMFTTVSLMGCGKSGDVPVKQYSIDLDAAREITLNGVAEITELEIGDDGKLYVLDAKTNQIHVFHGDGEHILSFGSAGAGPGELRNPKSIEVEDSFIYVAERGGTVHKFSLDGEFVARIKPSTIFHMNSSFHVVGGKVFVGGLKEEVGGFGTMMHVLDFENESSSIDFGAVPPSALKFNAKLLFGIYCVFPSDEICYCIQPTEYSLSTYSTSGDSLSSVLIDDPHFRPLNQSEPESMEQKMEWMGSFDKAVWMILAGKNQALIQIIDGESVWKYNIVNVESGKTIGRLVSLKRILAIDQEKKMVVLEGVASEAETAVSIIFADASEWVQ